MEVDWIQRAEKVWSLTLEIIFLLTEETFAHVKSDDHVTIPVSPPPSLAPQISTMHKILEVTSKIAEVLIVESGVKNEARHSTKEEIKNEKEEICLVGKVKSSGAPRNHYENIKPSRCQVTPQRCQVPPTQTEIGEEGLVMEVSTHTDNGSELCKETSGADVSVWQAAPERPLQDVDGSGAKETGNDWCEEIRTLVIGADGRYSQAIMKEHAAISLDGQSGDLVLDSTGLQSIASHHLHPAFLLSNPSTHVEYPTVFIGRPTGPKTKPSYPCSECGKSFTRKSELNDHVKIHSGEKSYSCSECEKSFFLRSQLVRHIRVHKVEKTFTCPVCNKCFFRNSDLISHERVHTGEKPYSCSECGKCFSDKSNLRKHKRVHTGERPFSCAECGKCFSFKTTLYKHRIIHTGEKPFCCSECGKCFPFKAALIQHERVHTGEKPYSCSQCGKCFSQKLALLTHEKIHSGNMLYTCYECGKSFPFKSALEIHERIHTGERPFACPQCGKCFSRKSHLITHQKIHTKAKKYTCSVCKECFPRKSDLMKHKELHTEGEALN